MKKIFLFLGALNLCLFSGNSKSFAEGEYTNSGFGTQTAWSNPEQNIGEGQIKPGYARIDWEPGKVMPVRLRDGMITLINLPTWEKIEDAYIGDKDFFDGRAVEKNTFMISPVDGRSVADTNMVLFGKSGNKYVFYLKSEPINTGTITNSEIEIIVPNSYKGKKSVIGGASSSAGKSNLTSLFAKSASGSAGDEAWEGEDFGWIKNIPVDPSQFRFDMDIFVPNPDDYVIAPERVWRDKIFTYIDFGEKALHMNQRPAVSILVEGGEAPVGFRTEGPLSRLIVVEAIGDFVLRSGQRIVCIKKRSKPFLASAPTINSNFTLPQSVKNLANGNYTNIQTQSAVSQEVNNGQAGFGFFNPNSMPAINNVTSQQSNFQTSSSYTQVNYDEEYRRNDARTNGSYLPDHYVPLVEQKTVSYAVEIKKGDSIKELEKSWEAMSAGKGNMLSRYQDRVFYSLEDEGVDELGSNLYHGNEVYRLRIGPFEEIDEPDELCKKLSGFRINCKVVRIQ
ncbi:MAG: TrbG/VirB9 family P-type conjugative transfer protein [Alphaproteobacteria bacterium]|jgi:hypothetical protein|nr:TrbG/VirB9 family P-type conjugative transfer protein [Alphaproteobacteria bacterium]